VPLEIEIRENVPTPDFRLSHETDSAHAKIYRDIGRAGAGSMAGGGKARTAPANCHRILKYQAREGSILRPSRMRNLSFHANRFLPAENQLTYFRAS